MAKGKEGKRSIGIVGLGSVGWSVLHGLSQFYPCSGYDIIGDYDWQEILGTDLVFVTVSTPEGADHRLDCSNVDDVIERLDESGYQGVVVIKSTVRIGYMEEASAKHPNLRLVYMPEFLRERSSYKWFMEPDRLVISGNPSDVDLVLSFFTWVGDVPILHISHRSAEAGKLAHNAFIATKVSFTNEVSSIANATGADPEEAMSIIWADRRVRSREHLRPGLGAYGGKCVPKDTRELIHSSDKAHLLVSVEEVNESQGRALVDTDNLKLTVIVPTRNRPELLDNALTSVARQSRKPDFLIVVSDCDQERLGITKRVVENHSSNLHLALVQNDGVHTLSGALNRGISAIIEHGFVPESTFLAILDDDDLWEVKYLDNCTRFAEEMGSDWVICGLIRHTPSHRGYQSIPAAISISDFLVGNPNIQGSNLFVRLSKIVSAGGFDESLESTTDRDICIRLLQQEGIRYSILRNHLVHHYANDDPSRLSYPGSERKRTGLLRFYEKYRGLMDESERTLFKERAQKLFNTEVD